MPKRHVTLAPGQAMLTALLVLGFLTLSFTLTGAASLVQDAQVALATENKALASAAAVGCMEQAMERLGLDQNYAGNETLTVASSTCTVRPVVVASSTWTIDTWSNVGDQYARYRTILSGRAPVVISSWLEMASF